MKHNNAFTYSSRFGVHCNTCGSLVEVCGDPEKCRNEAQLEIDEAILKGTSNDTLLDTAHRMLGDYILGVNPDTSRETKPTVKFKAVKG